MSLFDGSPDSHKMLGAPSIRRVFGEWVGSMRHKVAVLLRGPR